MSQTSSIAQFKQSMNKLLIDLDKKAATKSFGVLSGTIRKISGFILEATGLNVSVGSICSIDISSSGCKVFAQVIGFSDEITYLMAYEEIQGITPGNKVVYLYPLWRVPVGKTLLGRIINGLGQPIDNAGGLKASSYSHLEAPVINPIHRQRIRAPIDVGVRAINSLLSVGIGQRLGIFAGSGVGKSVLLGMITRFTKAEIVVVGLIGERGREVKEFIEENVGRDHLQKTIIIAAPVDTSPLMRVNAAMTATTIAEYFRDQGLDVLLIIDSLTRFAQAQRQVSLGLGEMPASKGFSPSVFSKISQLVERAGTGTEKQGSITAFYTVLIEGDDMSDPVADHVRSVLDGHIVLSRQLADSGHYPAIDIGSSISRVMSIVAKPEHLQQALKFKALFSAYEHHQDLIKMGMYQSGANSLVDESILYHSKMQSFLQQTVHENSSFDSSLHELMELFR